LAKSKLLQNLNLKKYKLFQKQRGDLTHTTMKKIIITFILTFPLWGLGGFTFAQSGTMLPDGFIMPNAATAGTCAVADKGKMFFNTTNNNMMVCNGTNWVPASSQWTPDPNMPSNIFFNTGNVGINTSTPQYKLDVNGTARIRSNLYVADKIGVGTTNNFGTGLEIFDGALAITSSADFKTWKLAYSNTDNGLSLQENGVTRMVFANGGNVGIGSSTPTTKLSVDGTGAFVGNLTVNNGKGVVRSSNATQLKCHLAALNLGATFTVSTNSCVTSTVSISTAGFGFSPTAQFGNLVSGTGDFGKLVVNVQSASTTAVVVRFCNTTTSNITLTNMIFNLLCIGF
jgi:hypothetical protein